MGNVNNIISLSGGKDSTAMLLLMLEKNIPIHSAVFFDTGWEFPQMHDHLDKLEKYTGVGLIRLRPEKTFNYWMFERRVVARKGEKRGTVHRIGNGWPSPMRRWCTRQKVSALEAYTKDFEKPVQCIGYAADEAHRAEAKTLNKKKHWKFRFPLIELGVDEREALSLCKSHGFDWGGLYDHFRRVSCFCCPLQRLNDLRILRNEFPDQWSQMLEWDASVPGHNRGFRDYATVHDLDAKFAYEESLTKFNEKSAAAVGE
ncbi:phosphoadenosine phosphosulfate reductase family protein [Maridesulfovibrio ferrireducens]|uniref:phosphoadenosine phosphosulfate reductase family protein n=1 Tax=Maridesulfovibrio ferrireducens TaxID=246191 RepID=UPI001A1CC684|nr:phosphoadenosine phosphosulfate reductase family protein [Maridesulfovibrio ferrireducens]MBI9110025.1 phosphoadenosine phosphosulfate reductase family protein [Maridesulfovibrio ferrireducens]